MPRAVRFDQYGSLDELHVEDVPTRAPGDDEVTVRVRAAGVNPGEAAIREGAMDAFAPAHFPSGQGTEFAGVVISVGDQVHGVAIGDEVIGFSDGRDAQADEVVLPVSNVLPKPKDVDWETAAIIPIAGATAISMVDSVRPRSGETAVVAGAAGGIGFVAAQLLIRHGVTVIGTAGAADQDALIARGIQAVVYGDGVEERIRRSAPNGVDAFLDTHGDGQADLAIALGVAPDRIDSIIDFESGQRLGIRNQGMYQLPDIRSAVVEFAHWVASGEIELPVRARFPLEQVRDAYEALTAAPGIGKIVLEISGDAEA
ncbi:MAG: NADP-dependent oxidoreductase [Rhodoglobus sp.]